MGREVRMNFKRPWIFFQRFTARVCINRFSGPDAGGNQTIELPQNSIVLNGNVKDDGEISSYMWYQIRYKYFLLILF